MSAKKDPRDAWIKLRVTREEKELVAAKAHAQGQTVADFLRQRALDYRLRQTPLEKEHVRQLARWANIHKNRAETTDVLIALMSSNSNYGANCLIRKAVFELTTRFLVQWDACKSPFAHGKGHN